MGVGPDEAVAFAEFCDCEGDLDRVEWVRRASEPLVIRERCESKSGRTLVLMTV